MTERAPLHADMREDGLVITDTNQLAVIARIPANNILSNLKLLKIHDGLLLSLEVIVDSFRIDKSTPAPMTSIEVRAQE